MSLTSSREIIKFYLCSPGHRYEAVGDDNYCTVIVSGADVIRVKLYIRTCLSVSQPTSNDKAVCFCHYYLAINEKSLETGPIISNDTECEVKYKHIMKLTCT